MKRERASDRGEGGDPGHARTISGGTVFRLFQNASLVAVAVASVACSDSLLPPQAPTAHPSPSQAHADLTASSTAYELVGWGGTVPAPPAGSDYTKVVAGSDVAIAFHSDGRLAAWGSDFWGQVSGAPTGGGYTDAAVGFAFAVAIRSDGSLQFWGTGGFGTETPPAGNNFIAVAAGQSHGVALRSDGTLASWGADISGQVSGTPTGNGFVAVAADRNWSMALRSNGSIVAWGADDGHQVSGAPTTGTYTAIAAGWNHGVAIRTDGSLASWGDDGAGEVSGTPTGTGFTSVAAGLLFSIAVRANGTLVAWGSNSTVVTNVPTGPGFARVAAGDENGVTLRNPVAPLVATLTGDLQALQLASGTANSLNAKLNAVLVALQAGDTAGACISLRSFINEVAAQRGKKISAADADNLIAEATAIMTQLGC